jgi:prepilin-type N-terminal cleavage/methylation domain-containing protein
MRHRNRQSGFTLIEILIVVIILGILAAIVIPQFTNASQDARKSSLASTVQTVKSQIELYKLQHKDKAPLLITDAAGQWEVFLQYSDIDGGLAAAPDLTVTPPINLGPYMQTAPVNPLLQSNVIGAPGTVDGSVGWTYDETTGEFHGIVPNKANDTWYESDDGVHDLATGNIID